MGVSLFLLIVSLPLQPLLAVEIFGCSANIVSMLPQFPLMQFLSCLLRAGCIALLIICSGNKKGGIWLEILVIVALAAVVPFINGAGTAFYNNLIANLNSEKLIAISTASSISSYLCYPASCGQVLAYITCGMSIAFKVMSKKQNAVQ